MGTKLYVGNLNYNTTEDSLRQAFGANGREVASVSILGREKESAAVIRWNS